MLTATRARARRLLTAALTAALVLGSAQAVVAAPPWLPPTDLAPPVEVSAFGSPSVATAPDGTTVVAFTQRDGAVNRVYAATRAPGGAFQPPVVLSDSPNSSSSPKAAVDPQGNVTVAWIVAGGVVQAAYRPAGQPWGPAQPLSSDGTTPTLAVGANGGAAVAWYATSGTQVAKVAVRAPGSQFFSSAVNASSAFLPYPNGPSGVFTPRVGMDAAGTVIAVWTRDVNNGGTSRRVVETATKPAGSPTFNAATNLSSYFTGDAGTDPTVVVTPAGKATAAWPYDDGSGFIRVDYADRPVNGAFGSSSPLANPAGVNVAATRLVGNANGDLAVSWVQSGSLYASVRPNGGAFTSPLPVAGPPAAVTSSSVAMSDNGDALVVWPSLSTGDYSVFSSRRRANGTFGEVTEVVHGKGTAPTTAYYSPAVGMDDQGNAFVAVRREVSAEPTSSATVAIGYDVVAPALGAVNAPATVTVGKATSFATSATDRMGSPTISWSFGDGGTATGGSVSHTFAAAGVFTVKATAVDAAGNSSESTRLVQVSKAPVKTVPRIAATSALRTTSLRAGKTRVKSLRVSHLRKGDRVTLVCKTKARGCKKTTLRTTRATGSSLSLTKYVKGLTLKQKATLVLKITRTGATSRTIVYTTRAKKAPTKKVR